jgi:prepilin-type N-terminal cleavage/methylation domain-containing protein
MDISKPVKTRNKGFTLIELLVVITIMALLTGVILVSYRVGERKFALKRSTVKLASDIRRVQEMAVASEECRPGLCCDPDNCPGAAVPAGGYGIFINKTMDHYMLYSDVDNSKGCLNPCDDPVNDPVIEEASLEQRVRIEKIEVEGIGERDFFSINFTPPDPETNINVDFLDGSKVKITLCLDDTDCLGSNAKTITVNKAGGIDMD